MFKSLRVMAKLSLVMIAAGLVQTDPNAVAQRWAQNLGGATEKIRAGVMAVSGQSPGQRAAAQKAKWLQKLQLAADKWATRVAAVSLPEWQQAMIDKGLPRIGTGAQAALPKFTAFMTQFLSYVNQGAATVRAMPKVTLDDGINRAVAMIRYNANFKYNKAG